MCCGVEVLLAEERDEEVGVHRYSHQLGVHQGDAHLRGRGYVAGGRGKGKGG